MLSLSVVSHGQGALVRCMMESVVRHPPPVPWELLLTLNLPERDPISSSEAGVSVIIHRNDFPRGFAANHNAAFRRARGSRFCVLNPDLVFPGPVFDRLLALVGDPGVGVVAPGIVDEKGRLEDSFRRLPRPWPLLRRLVARRSHPDVTPIGPDGLARPDWIAGMFLLMKSEVFEALDGFDEGYFMYCEDIDLGIRARQAGYDLIVDTRTAVVHDARRASRRRPRHFIRHATSMARLLVSSPYRQIGRNRNG